MNAANDQSSPPSPSDNDHIVLKTILNGPVALPRTEKAGPIARAGIVYGQQHTGTRTLWSGENGGSLEMDITIIAPFSFDSRVK